MEVFKYVKALCNPNYVRKQKPRLQKRKRAFCLEMGRGILGSPPTGQTPRAPQSRARGASTERASLRKTTPALVLSFSLKLNLLLGFGAAPSSSPWTPFLCSDPPRPPQCKDCSGLRCANCRNLSCYFVSLQPSGQPARPTRHFPGRPLFSKRKGRRKSKPHNGCRGETL